MEAKNEAGSRSPWQPREEALTEICGILELEVSKTSRIEKSQYMQQQQQLRHYSQSPDFNNYLVFILSRAEGRSLEIRKAAGLLLKNNLRNGFKSMSPANQQYIKLELLSCLGSPDRKIRSITGSIISIIVQLGGIVGWPELLHALGTCLDGDDLNQLHGAMDALSKICKGVPQVLDSDVPGMNERPLNLFLPRFFKLFQSPHSMLRKLALNSVNQYITLMPASLYKSMDQYLQGLFVLANDTMPEVQKLVYDAFVKLIEVHPSLLQPHLRNVIEYALQVSQDGGDKVAVEAREFWAAYSDAPLPPDNLREFLQRLIPALPSSKVYASDDESLAEAEEDEFVGDRVPDQKPLVMNISAQEWESLIEDFQFGGSRRHQWTSQFTPLSLLDLSLSSLLKNDLNSSIKLEILVFLQEFSFLFITNEDLRISVSKIIETLKLVIQSPIDGVSVTSSLKEQILVSTTSIIVTLNDEENDSSFGAVLAELEALVAVLIAIINRPNHVADRQTRAVACECLRVLEERFPGLLAEIVGHLWALCQSEKSHACQSYLLLLLQVIHHIVDMKLRVDSIINISVPLAPFNVPNCYGGEELSSKNVKDLRRVVAFLLEWAQVFTPSGLTEFLSMVIPVAVALELQVSLLKVQFSGLLYTLNPLLNHLVVMMYLNFPGSFDGQEGEIMKRLFLISRERYHRVEFRLLSLHWLLSIIGKGSLVSSNRKYIYPNVFDPLALKCLKLDLFALCYISLDSTEKDVELFVKYLDSFVNGFKWLPSQSTETAVGFRTIHKLLTGTLCHSSTSKALLESTIFHNLQSMLLNLILDSQKLVPVVVSLIDRFLQCQNHVFLGENLLQMFDEHLLPKLTVSYRLNSYFPIFDRICRSSSISPQRLLGLLKKFMVFLQNEHGPDSGLRSWSQGSRVIRICRTMLMHHHSSRLFIPLSHLLAFTCLCFPDLEVRDNARIYLRMLVCIPGKKLRQMLNFGEQQTGIYMGISPSSHANSFFSVRKSKSITSYINLERAVPLLVKQSWSLSLPTLGLTNKSSDAPVVIKDDVGLDNSEFSLEARKIERNPEPLRVMDAKITRILEILRLHFSCIPDVGLKIKIPCVLRFKSEPFKSIYATVLAFSSTAPYGNIPSFRIPFLTEKSGAAVTIEIEPREPVPGIVDVSVQSNAENGEIIDGQIQSISVGIEDMFLRAIAPANITNDQTPNYYSNLFEALWEACGSSSNTGREIFSMKNGKGVATIHGTQSVKLIQARSSYVIHVIEENLARFVVSVMGEPLVTMVKDGGFVKDVSWKVVTADCGGEKGYSDYEQWPLYLTYYNEEEDDGEDGFSGVVKKNLGCFQVLVFLPPRFHLLLHFEVSDVSTLVRIRTDHWPCLAYIDDYLEALFVL